MAEVYKAYHPALDRYVAIKLLYSGLGEEDRFRLRFKEEARHTARLRHPNIVRVYDFDLDPDRQLYYLVMEYIEGTTLQTYLARHRQQQAVVSVSEALAITSTLGSALAYAHSQGVFHRDLKPANIMIDSTRRLVLTDFGIAQLLELRDRGEGEKIIGTPAYMSPEQIKGDPVDHRSDLYSLGIILYEMLAGSPPFSADTSVALYVKHVYEHLPSITQANPTVPISLGYILRKALAKTPQDRYQSVEAMLEDLSHPEDAARHLAVEFTANYSHSHNSQRHERRSNKLRTFAIWPLLLLIVSAALLNGIYFSLFRRPDSLALKSALLPSEATLDSPTATTLPSSLAPTSPPTVAATSTSGAAIPQLTIDALSTYVVSPPTSIPTPDLTGTHIACAYAYEIAEQHPEDGAVYPELTTLTKRITIRNIGECDLDRRTRLVADFSSPLRGERSIEIGNDIAPGEELEIILPLRTPAYDRSQPRITSMWHVKLPSGYEVGAPFTFDLVLFINNG